MGFMPLAVCIVMALVHHCIIPPHLPVYCKCEGVLHCDSTTLKDSVEKAALTSTEAAVQMERSNVTVVRGALPAVLEKGVWPSEELEPLALSVLMWVYYRSLKPRQRVEL